MTDGILSSSSTRTIHRNDCGPAAVGGIATSAIALVALLFVGIAEQTAAEGIAADRLMAYIAEQTYLASGVARLPPGNQVRIMAEPIRIPNFFETKSGEIPSVEIFMQVPGPSGEVFAASDKRIVSQLRDLAKNITLGRRTLNADEKQQMVAARKLLYDGGTPPEHSAVYNKYLRYEKQHNELTAKLGAATSTAEQVNARTALDRNDQDWSVYGRRGEVDNALLILASLDDIAVKQLREDWETQLTTVGRSPSTAVWDALAEDSGWITVTKEVPPDKAIELPLRMTRGRGDPAAVAPAQSVRVIKISFRVCRVPIGHPELDHPFMRSRLWRSSQDEVISNGGVADPSKRELVPRVVKELLVVKTVEITLTPEDWQLVSGALPVAQRVTIGSLTLRDGDSSYCYSSPRMITLQYPLIVAALVADLPKTPDPEPNLRWDQEK